MSSKDTQPVGTSASANAAQPVGAGLPANAAPEHAELRGQARSHNTIAPHSTIASHAIVRRRSLQYRLGALRAGLKAALRAFRTHQIKHPQR